MSAASNDCKVYLGEDLDGLIHPTSLGLGVLKARPRAGCAWASTPNQHRSTRNYETTMSIVLHVGRSSSISDFIRSQLRNSTPAP